MVKYLFIGRFQPPHIGHLELLNKYGIKNNEIIVVLVYTKGKEEKLNYDNPIPYKIRYECLNYALSNSNIKYKIITLNLFDIFNGITNIWKEIDEKAYIVTKDLDRFILYKIFSLISKAFGKNIGVIYDNSNTIIRASDIRELIRNNEEWRKYSICHPLDYIIEKFVKTNENQRKITKVIPL